MGKQYNARQKRARRKGKIKRKKKEGKVLKQQKKSQKEAPAGTKAS